MSVWGDKWFFFELVGIKKDGIKCTSDFKLWWIGANDVGLKELAFYNHALELENFASSHKTQVKVYVKKLNGGEVVVIVGDVVAPGNGNEGVVTISESDGSDFESGSKNDNEDTLFEDSEEERAVAVDDDFDSEEEPLVNLTLKK